MIVHCAQADLLKALAVVTRAIPQKSNLAVLTNVLIETTEEGRIRLKGTNLEWSACITIDAVVMEDGQITVPAKTLHEFITQLPAERVTLKTNDRTITLDLECGRHAISIKGLAAIEYPAIPDRAPNNTSVTRMKLDALKQAINQVSYAASEDIARPVLGAVFCFLKGSQTIFATTDGLRLAVKTIKLDDSPLFVPVTALVPAKHMIELGKIISSIKNSSEVEVELHHEAIRNRMFFVLSDVVVVSQLVDGNFPNYKQIIPPSFATELRIAKDTLQRDLKIAAIFARDSSNLTKFVLQQGGPNDDGTASTDTLTISAISAEAGEGASTIDCTVHGNDLTIAFNAQYLLDALSVVDSAEIWIGFNKASSPALIKGYPDDKGYIGVIMPMHVNGLTNPPTTKKKKGKQ